MAKYKDNKIDVMESEADIAIDERRAFGHFHDKGVHHHDGHKNDCHCHDCIDEEDCDYCGKDLASCQCDFLGKEYKRGLYHMEHLDCMECAAKMEGKIREMPSVFFASISFTKKELRVISKENPDNLIPQLLSVAAPSMKISASYRPLTRAISRRKSMRSPPLTVQPAPSSSKSS